LAAFLWRNYLISTVSTVLASVKKNLPMLKNNFETLFKEHVVHAESRISFTKMIGKPLLNLKMVPKSTFPITKK
jgi:hypothetical protein